MNSKDIRGLKVISIADGTQIGTIDQVYLDLAAKQVVGFSITHGRGPFGGRATTRQPSPPPPSTRSGQMRSRSMMSRRRMLPGSAPRMGHSSRSTPWWGARSSPRGAPMSERWPRWSSMSGRLPSPRWRSPQGS